MPQDILTQYGFAGLGILAILGVILAGRFLGVQLAKLITYVISDFGPGLLKRFDVITEGQDNISKAMGEQTKAVTESTQSVITASAEHTTGMRESIKQVIEANVGIGTEVKSTHSMVKEIHEVIIPGGKKQ